MLLLRAGAEVAARERRRVVEGLVRTLTQCRRLLDDARGVEALLHAQHRLLRRFKQRIQPRDTRHRQDDVAILASDIDVLGNIVRDIPDEARNGIVQSLVHFILPVITSGAQSPPWPVTEPTVWTVLRVSSITVYCFVPRDANCHNATSLSIHAPAEGAPAARRRELTKVKMRNPAGREAGELAFAEGARPPGPPIYAEAAPVPRASLNRAPNRRPRWNAPSLPPESGIREG